MGQQPMGLSDMPEVLLKLIIAHIFGFPQLPAAVPDLGTAWVLPASDSRVLSVSSLLCRLGQGHDELWRQRSVIRASQEGMPFPTIINQGMPSDYYFMADRHLAQIIKLKRDGRLSQLFANLRGGVGVLPTWVGVYEEEEQVEYEDEDWFAIFFELFS